MSKFTPVFTRDANSYIIPNQDFIQETPELADVAGVAANLVPTYGLVYSGRIEELADDGSFAGPYVEARIANKTVFIVAGDTLAGLLEQRNPAVQNLPSSGNAE